MELALGALDGLAPKLADLLKTEYVNQKGLKPDIEALSREVLVMRARLAGVARVPREQLPEIDKVWARRVRELAYDTEDAVDAFIVRILGSELAEDDPNVLKSLGRKATSIVNNLKGRHQLADRVKDIKNLTKEFADLFARYRINYHPVNPTLSTAIDPRLLNMYKSEVETELVGIEAPRDELIRRLTNGGSEKNLKIVSIVGFGGLGKTALAKTVYNRLKKQFDCSAFVSVGRTPQLTSVLKELLGTLDKNKYSNTNMAVWDCERLTDELHRFLHDKRFFIVIDDIWDTDSWKIILYTLKDGNCGSRIIMTTRNRMVLTKDEDVYELNPLSHDDSKILFSKRILSGEGECIAYQSDELLDEILRKCGGVPLAIIAMAGLLVDKPRKQWSEVYDSVYGHGGSTMKIISYSYEDLPPHLKSCLLYMSTFPEDSHFGKYELIWMWIGEGFVQIKREGDSILEQGERYFNELLNRSMIHPIEDKFDCSIYACRVYDIVYDFISRLSREENFTTILVREQYTSSKSVRRKMEIDFQSFNMKVRRICLQKCHFEHIPHDTLGMPEAVRSLFILDSRIDTTPQLYCFQVCHVLFIKDSNIPNLKHLGKLLHLRYLEINCTHVDKLPEEIADLKSLQTLILTDIGLHELPSTICALTQLMCMHIIGFKRVPMNMMGNLLNLEELVLDPIVSWSEADDVVVQLGKVRRLRVLHIKFAKGMDASSQNALVSSLHNLEKLQDLKLIYPEHMEATAAWQGWVPPRRLWRLLLSNIIFFRLPAWLGPSHLPHLSNLDVSAHVVKRQDLDKLARLPELCYLRLQGLIIHQGYTVCATTGGFKKLRVCNVGTSFKFLQGAMPSLQVLSHVVFVAGQLHTMHQILPTKDASGNLDLGLENLLSLERVTVYVDCEDADKSDVEDAEAMVRRAAEDHPNRPTLIMERIHEDLMFSDEHALSPKQEDHNIFSKSVLDTEKKDNKLFIVETDDGSSSLPVKEVKELPQGADMIWVLDFSARMHSTGNLGLLHRLPSSLKDPDDCLPSLWRGSIRTEQFEIPDVRYVRGDPRNVISVAQLARSHGLVTIFEPPNAYVTDDPATGKEVGRAHLRDDGVYVLDHLRISKPQSLMEIYQDNCLALEKALDDERADPVDLPFLFLKAITKDFSDDQRIGSGGYGTVYKGAIQNRMVAVKKLHDRVDVLEKNFQREIDSLIEVKHKNIVRFLGYCSDTQELMKLFEGKYVLAEVRQRLFCFEYLSNGSLADRLTEASSGLQWGVRYQIIKGICNGLLYLHQRKIIHMDLKPENILLDDSMVPRIADFGLSRCFGENQTRAITENQAGTRGYMAPELLRDGIITLETDIFSLGVIIAYILMESKERPNVHKVLERWMNTFGTSENHALLEQVKVCAEIGRNCMDDNPSKRPTIQDIICRLDEMDISNSSVRSVGTTTTLAGQV